MSFVSPRRHPKVGPKHSSLVLGRHQRKQSHHKSAAQRQADYLAAVARWEADNA